MAYSGKWHRLENTEIWKDYVEDIPALTRTLWLRWIKWSILRLCVT